MRIGLVVPDFLSGTSFLQQPLDFLYTSSILEEANYEVIIIDCRVKHLSMKNLLKKVQYCDLIIITTTPSDQVQNYFLDYRYAYAINTINYLRKRLISTKIAICGAHVSVRPDLIIKDIDCDYYIRGEIIFVALNIANALSGKTSIKDVPNLIIKENNSYYETEYDEKLYHPIIPDNILPDFSKVNMDRYFGVKYVNNVPIRRIKRAVIQGGRGCPYKCSFCHNFYGAKINRRNPKVVANELEICQKKYGIEEVFFLDEVFTLDKRWLNSLMLELKSKGINLEYTIQTRVDCIDDDVLYILKEIGVKNIWLGVESANDNILKISNKGINIVDINNAINLIKKYNIIPNAFFMLGMPGETIESINQTIRQIYESKISYTRSIMICTPRYNTPYAILAMKQFPFINNHWFNLNAVKGLVDNQVNLELIMQAKSILKERDFIYKDKCPKIEI